MSLNYSWHRGCQKSSITKNVKDILTGRHKDGLALADVDAIDVGITPQAHDNDKGVTMKVNLLSHLYDNMVNNEIGAVDKL